jgi:hypothetical protein
MDFNLPWRPDCSGFGLARGSDEDGPGLPAAGAGRQALPADVPASSCRGGRIAWGSGRGRGGLGRAWRGGLAGGAGVAEGLTQASESSSESSEGGVAVDVY